MANSFAAHLDSLRDFGRELEDQLDSLNAARDTVLSLAAAQLLLGAFVEAESLVARHDAAVAQLQTLLEGIREAISFAEEVTHTVADSYRASDDRATASLTPTMSSGGAV